MRLLPTITNPKCRNILLIEVLSNMNRCIEIAQLLSNKFRLMASAESDRRLISVRTNFDRYSNYVVKCGLVLPFLF